MPITPSFLTGMPIWSSIFSMTPSRRAATSDFSIQSIRRQLVEDQRLDRRIRRRWRGSAGLGQRGGAEQQQATRAQRGDRFRDRSWLDEPPRLQGVAGLTPGSRRELRSVSSPAGRIARTLAQCRNGQRNRTDS